MKIESINKSYKPFPVFNYSVKHEISCSALKLNELSIHKGSRWKSRKQIFASNFSQTNFRINKILH